MRNCEFFLFAVEPEGESPETVKKYRKIIIFPEKIMNKGPISNDKGLIYWVYFAFGQIVV